MTKVTAAESFRIALKKLVETRGQSELADEQVGHPQTNLDFLRTACRFLDGRETQANLYTAYLKLIRNCHGC